MQISLKKIMLIYKIIFPYLLKIYFWRLVLRCLTVLEVQILIRAQLSEIRKWLRLVLGWVTLFGSPTKFKFKKV